MSVRNLILAAAVTAWAPADGPPTAAPADDSAVPKALAPFEYLVGAWKGSGVPTADRIKGWPERHVWAWKFEGGRPVGLAVELTGDKVLTRAVLTPDAAKNAYRLDAKGADGKAVAYRGTLDAAGRTLTLDRVGEQAGGGLRRLTLFPNANAVRYSLWVSDREPGAPQFKRTIEAGLTKEGEAFASGGAAADGPKCVVTGGAATMTVAYNGASYPLCCTGCRDEFNENPEKYLKKLAARAAGAPSAAGKPAAETRKDDGAFAGLDDETPPKAAPRDAPKPPAAGKPATPAAKPVANPSARAASLLKLGQNLEKAGKPDAALGYYRQVVRDFPGTPAAKGARARVKDLTGQ